MPDRPVLEGELTLLAAGGRRTAIASGYRPALDVGDTEWGLRDAWLQRTDADEPIEPGQSAPVRLYLLAERAVPAHIGAGSLVPVREGARVVGQLTVARVCADSSEDLHADPATRPLRTVR